MTNMKSCGYTCAVSQDERAKYTVCNNFKIFESTVHILQDMQTPCKCVQYCIYGNGRYNYTYMISYCMYRFWLF